MRAEIIAVGSEMLGAERQDTNSLFLTRELAALGIAVCRKSVLPDDEASLAAAIRDACARAELVVCTGGLGPTEDDRTRAAAAAALGCVLRRDPAAVARLQEHYQRLHRTPVEMDLRQADRLEFADWLLNPMGSASGQWCPTASGFLVLLPGPPREMQSVFADQVRPRLAALAPSRFFFTRVLSLVGLPESAVDQRAAPIYSKFSNPQTTILATAGPQVELHFQAWGATAAQAQSRADELAAAVAAEFGEAVFSDEQESLAAVVGRLLRAAGQTVAVAESCTGGLLGALLTAVPGASQYFLGGAICYTNSAKQDLAGVTLATLQHHGAVSAACACELADGIRQRFGADWGLAITGIAGPDGGTLEKPVGTVFIGLSRPGHPAEALACELAGDRERIRRWSAQNALDLLRLRLLR